jgi:phospholipid-translocating ATPase
VVRSEKSKLTAVEVLDVPKMKKDVHTFLGITGYYRRFIPNYSSLAAPLTDLTRKSAPYQMVWDAGCAQLKKLLCQDPILHNPDFDKPFKLQTDASERGVGAVLSQKDDSGFDHPVC